jgi:hypothetical protein
MSDAAFADVPATPAGHFGLYFHAAVYRLLNHIRRLADADGPDLATMLGRHPFLARYGDTVRPYLPAGLSWEGALGWWEREITAWESTIDRHLPLLALARDGGIGFRERVAMFVLGLGEEDARFGSLFADLQEPPGRRRPCLELLGRLMGDPAGADGAGLYRALAGAGLAEVVDREVARAEWELRVPALVWEAVRDGAAGPAAGYVRRDAADLPVLDELILPDPLRARLAQIPGLLATGLAAGLVVRGTPGSERREVVGAVARALGRGVLEVAAGGSAGERVWPLLGPLCTLTAAMPVIVCDPLPGETITLPALTGYRGPLGVVIGPAGGVTGAVGSDAVSLTLPSPAPTERLRHWRRAFGPHAVEHLEGISDRFRLPPVYLRQAAAGAVVRARLDGRHAVGAADVADACRAMNRELLDTLATRLEVETTWDRLVVSPATATRLWELGRRCRYRETLATEAGTGVRALFSGASGTGKTLAARILAGAELGMDLYRVDLAAVVSRYIGETEKNLHRVLSAAEELDVVLLLDEGEGLLGHRTEVRSANDRWANLETDFLLQRLETYQGIVVVTTNAPDHVDPAFQRRMDVVVHFVPPQATERWRLLQLHLPKRHAIAREELERIATRCAMTGAQIRNAALHAVLLALDDGSAMLARHHLEAAIHSEYRKAGAMSPLSEAGRPEAAPGRIDAFVRGLAETT